MNATERYLALLKSSLLNELYIENEARLVYVALCMAGAGRIEEPVLRDIGRYRPEILQRLRSTRNEGSIGFNWQIPGPEGHPRTVNLRNLTEVYHTMIGRKRLDNIHQLLNSIAADKIPGDVIETGVWRGGAVVFMAGFLAVHGFGDRSVWAADSFAGLPVPTKPQDAGYDFSARVFPVLSISRADVEELFRRYDLLAPNVKFLEGWFKDTLPTAPIKKLALMRLDGDLYESTMDALVPLYDKLSKGGYVIVDDYNDFAPCRRAVDEFRAARKITSPLVGIDWTGVYWRKEA